MVHGDEDAQLSLSDEIHKLFDIRVEIPFRGDVYDITPKKLSKIGEIKSPNEYKFARLELIERLATLKEEIEDMTTMISEDLKRETSDKKVDELTEKVKELESFIVSIVEEQDE